MGWKNEFYKENLTEFVDEMEKDLINVHKRIYNNGEKNHFKVLKSFQDIGVSDFHFNESTGYGYGDTGREILDELYARIFGAEMGLVRPQMVSGTHAITLCLFGILRPGDELLSITGKPYDTLAMVTGEVGEKGGGSLSDWGVTHRVVDLKENGMPDYKEIKNNINPKTKMISIQRSKGYSSRPSFNIEEIRKLVDMVKGIDENIICFVDNCYGEFVEELEPTQVGVDLMAGSLIKNPGGGIAPGGGYVVGKEKLVEKVANRLTAPGLGGELGSSISGKRSYFQGLYLAPLVVMEALKGATLIARTFTELGFPVSPKWHEERTDIIQAIALGSEEKMLAFCQGLQRGSPIDSYITPIPSTMPGYEDQVIMAGGTFIQGSSIELSADGPLREPYTVYLQGGLSYAYIKAALLEILNELTEKDLIKL